jgi:hypothetical protein
MRTPTRAVVAAELAAVALLSVACTTSHDPAPGPATPTVNADPVARTCTDFGTFRTNYASLSDQQRQALINTMSDSAGVSQDLDLMRGVVDLGDGYLKKDQTRMTSGVRTLTARCAGGGKTPATTAPATHRATPPPSPRKTVAALPPTRTPSALVGRWQGGANDAFWYTFTASGKFTMENRQTNIHFAGYSRVTGQKITLYANDGRVFIKARSWSVEGTEVYGEAIHTLLLDGDSYAKDEYYKG